MTDNTPEVYNTPNGFYTRREIDNAPTISDRRIKVVGQCKLCSLVPRLQAEKGLTFTEACDVEHDLYRFIYTMWGAEEISHWLFRNHDFTVSHDAISSHIKKHIPDPQIVMMERVKSYRPDIMNKKFFRNVSDTMKMSIFQFQQDVASGRRRLDPKEFLNMVSALREWQDILGEDEQTVQSHVNFVIEAMSKAMDEVLSDYPELKQELIVVFREKLSAMEDEDE